MLHFDSFKAAGNYLIGAAVRQQRRLNLQLLQEVGEAIAAEARNEIGEYQPAIDQYPEWAPLALSTLEKKQRMGWGRGGNPDTPLFATGGFRDRIGYKVLSGSLAVVVGTDVDYIMFTELGTAKMPPRPVFGPAALRALPKFLPRIGPKTAAALGGWNAFNVYSWPQSSRQNYGNTVVGP